MITQKPSQPNSKKHLEAKTILQPAIIMPTFNNADTLCDVLKKSAKTGLAIIVVNDGSSDKTPDILEKWRDEAKRHFVITHKFNQGKAQALRSGFAFAIENQFTHALTIDTDGQHNPQDGMALLEAAKHCPGALVIGAREKDIYGYPALSKIGRWISNKMIELESGVKISDSQSGLRVYPLKITQSLTARAQRYAFETEIIVRFGWRKIQVTETPISCIYKLENQKRVSHFRVGRDSLEAFFMHIKLLLLALLPGKIINKQNKEILISKRNPSVFTGTIFDRSINWLNPWRLVREVHQQTKARQRLAASLATGMFMAPLPIYCIKTVVCLATAKLFRLEPLAVVGASSLSTPPMGFIFIFLSIVTGHLVLCGQLPDINQYDLTNMHITTMLWYSLLQWLVGSIIVGGVLGFFTYILISAIAKLFPFAQDSSTSDNK